MPADGHVGFAEEGMVDMISARPIPSERTEPAVRAQDSMTDQLSEGEPRAPPVRQSTRRMGLSSASIAVSDKPAYEKTAEERKEVMDLIKTSRDSKVNLMMDTVSKDTLEEVVDAMFHKSIPAGQVVMQDGEHQGLVYIVQSGSFDVLEPPVQPGDGGDREPVKVFEATVGHSFGGHVGQSMDSNLTVVATEDSKVWCIEMEVFRMLVVSSAEEQFKANCGFLRNCGILSALTEEQIAALAEVIMEEDFENDEAIVEQDDRDTNMFILREGSAIASITGPQGDVEVAKYGPGQYFGEIALLLGKSRQATVHAVGHVKCLYINRESFNRLLGPLRDILRNNIDKYENYAKFLDDDLPVGAQNSSRSVTSGTPRGETHAVFDGTWEKYKIRGQTFRKKVAKTFAKLPETKAEDEAEAVEEAKPPEEEAEPTSLKEKIEWDFTQLALVSPTDAFAVQPCGLQSFGGIRLGEQFTLDKVLLMRSSMTPEVDALEDHYSWREQTWTKGSTQIAALCQKGHKSADDPTPNQDNYFILHKDMVQVYGVADGHGPFGHLVSFRLVQTLPHFLVNSKHYGKDWEQALREAFLSAQSDLLQFAADHNVNIEASGAAGSILVFEGPAVHIAHIGDAGVMLASWNRRDSRLITGTEDHKPQLPAEKQRLEEAGSDVREVDEGSWRIYRKGTTFPGLTMSRAFGDTACDGVLQEPEYKKVLLQPSDEVYAVIASDGIWEFINYEKAVELSAKKLRLKGPAETARFLIEASRKRWKLAADTYCDDITIMVVQWNVPSKGADANFKMTLKRHE